MSDVDPERAQHSPAEPIETVAAEVAASNEDPQTSREAVEQELMAEGRSEEAEQLGQPTE
jgi:hypothetical protein